MNRIIRAIDRIAFIGALSMVMLTLLKVMEAFAGELPSRVFAICSVIYLLLPKDAKRGPAHD